MVETPPGAALATMPGAAEAAAPSAAVGDPLGLVPMADFQRRYTMDGDTLEVWRCGPVGMSHASIIASLEETVSPYYAAVSDSVYSVSYVAGGDVPGPAGSCLDQVEVRKGGTACPACDLSQFEFLEAKTCSGAPYCTDGGQFKEAGIDSLICGPGDLDQAHQPDESIGREAFESGAEIVLRVLERMCGARPRSR